MLKLTRNFLFKYFIYIGCLDGYKSKEHDSKNKKPTFAGYVFFPFLLSLLFTKKMIYWLLTSSFLWISLQVSIYKVSKSKL